MLDSFAVVIPYYNEIDYLRTTLESWLAQTRLPEQLILVDNASTDGSGALCRRLLQGERRLEVTHLYQPQPGKVHALELACRHVKRRNVAFCDADTYYPPHYLELCEALFAEAPANVVALMAKDIYASPAAISSRLNRYGFCWLSKIMRSHTFTGGCGQVFRADALRKIGGYSADLWDFTMEDHEIMCRMAKVGRAQYHPDLWCQPADRRSDRSQTHWSLYERSLYYFARQDWYFYDFLAPRFAGRRMTQERLRQRDLAA